ncbi:MAG TPA: TIGR04211 family SH3 domain-containing protein [Candidatus Binatia bacterium]|nr:TIGR04211 family SH3 domain-containing protein [Candidatus Binatia bacterium]
MPFPRLAAALLLLAAAPLAAAETRFVSDELALTLRQGPDNAATGLGFVQSGVRVEVLETDAGGGYAHVRLADGREGYLLGKYLKSEPPARERVQRMEKDLAAAQSELKALRAEYDALQKEHARVTSGMPAPAPEDLVRENAMLKDQMQQMQSRASQAVKENDIELARQRTMLLGGGLVLAGAVVSLLLRLLWPRRRTWGDL